MVSAAALAAPAVVVAVPQAAGVKVKVVLSKLTPAGKVSGNWIVVTAAAGLPAGLVTVRLNTLVPPLLMLDGVKLLATVGGA